ncbi:hypothetical protein [Spongiivirga citrea]|uniref:Uncharacterized protein n=1 Tax=Spongiivirga citrea TaxID=1481457 RepID=A0A6M0CLZ7_9FLAO|nr:hypothetical protein [Spongiivirga citrea]NER18955.1 hypothetical protein [Spongiivirga citrea]
MTNQIPKELRTIIDNEETDFITKSRRNHPRKKAISLLFFSLFWNGFISIFVVAFFGPLLKKLFNKQSSNDISFSDFFDVMPALIISLFVIVGIGLLVWTIMMFFQKGAFFVGTPTRFIKFRKGKAEIKDWEQFSGNIKIDGKGIYGNLEFELRTGKTKSRDNGPDKFVPDVIDMAGIKNTYDIGKKCRKRIKENDPTPAIKL